MLKKLLKAQAAILFVILTILFIKKPTKKNFSDGVPCEKNNYDELIDLIP